MSQTTKKKYVVDEVLNNYNLPTENQQIVKVLHGRGNNLHEVETAEGEKFLASMPTKFRKNIWIKRGDFLVVEPIPEGVKVKAEIVQILLKDQIKYFKSQEIWPAGFDKDMEMDKRKQCGNGFNEDDDLFVNTNRPVVDDSESSCESSSEDSECESASDNESKNVSSGADEHD